MATLAVAGLGAWATAGTALGWQAGWIVGSAIGSLLFNKVPDQEGPRLSDLSVTSSTYGANVQIGYGTLRLPGNIIWSSGIREEKSTERAGKGGGGKLTTYTYFASFALAFGEGVADDILRIWADGKLIYDKRGTSGITTKPGLRFRFHTGSEAQLPDPLIEASEGAGNVPAHRGLCHVVFEDLPLQDFGNRIPNMTAEITFNAVPVKPYDVLDFITQSEGGFFGGYQRGEFGADWTRGHGYLLDSDIDPDNAGIRRFDLRTMTEDRQARMSDVSQGATPNNFPRMLFVGTDSHLYFNAGSSNSRPILRVEPDSLREVARFGALSNGLSNTTSRFVTLDYAAMVSFFVAEGRRDFLLTGSLFDDLGLLDVRDMSHVWGAGRSVDESRVKGITAGFVGEGYGDGWILGSNQSPSLNHNSIGLYRLRVSGTDQDFRKVKAFVASEIESTATGFYGKAGSLTYDPTDDSVMLTMRMSNDGTAGSVYAIKWRDETGIVWKTVVPFQVNYDGPPNNTTRLRNGRWAIMGSTRITQLDTVTGEIVYDDTWPVNVFGFQHYHALTESIICNSANEGVVRIYLNRGDGDGVPLSGIVQDLCRRTGLDAGEIDVTELTEIVPGYVIGRPTPVRDAIQPLSQAYFFDGVESDYTLKFRKRGRAADMTLDPDLLIPLSGGSNETWRETRTQDVDLPQRINIIHIDKDVDYQQGLQAQKRVTRPAPTMASLNQVSVELPIAMTAGTAKTIAGRALNAAWVERSRHEALVPSDYLALDPTDVVGVALPSGTSLLLRVERMEVGADFSVSLRAVTQDVASYSSSLVADGGSGRPEQELGGGPETRLILPDIPLLRDIDDTGGASSRIYIALGGYGQANWPGAAAYRSDDNITWDVAEKSGTEIAWGAAISVLPETDAPFATDEETELEVYMTTGAEQLESVTQEALLNGANAALVLKANGEAEIIQFREVTPNVTGSHTLTGLLRGRRGTDVFTGGHAIGETFVLLQRKAIEGSTLALSELDAVTYWRAVGKGQLFDDVQTVTRTHTGRDLKPYAVAGAAASLSGSDIALSWVRRTRIGGDLRDGTGTVPLSEAHEAYEVDILDGPGGTVLRTLTASGPAVTYAGADIAADLGSTPTDLSVVIYQMSDVVGRGFPRAVTLEIA